MHAVIITYNQQYIYQLSFANVSDLQCGPRPVEDITTVVGNIMGKNRDRLLKMYSTDFVMSVNQVVTLCSITT